MHLGPTVFWAFAFYTVPATIWGAVLALTLCAGWLDWRTRKIPNWLTVSGVVAGLALHVVLEGWYGAKASLEGAGLALGILLPFVLLRALGAGDWKLMGAIGALMGWHPMLFVLLASLVVSGLMGAAQMILTKRVKRTLWNVLRLAAGLMTFGLRLDPALTLDNPTLLKVPFGVATAMAAVLSFTIVHWR